MLSSADAEALPGMSHTFTLLPEVPSSIDKLFECILLREYFNGYEILGLRSTDRYEAGQTLVVSGL